MDYTIIIYNQTGLGQMTFDKATTLMNNIYLSWMVDQGSFFLDPKFGSRFYLLKRAKNTPKTAKLAIGYGKEALQWMFDAGKVSAVNVYAQINKTENINRLKILGEITPVNGNDPVSFSRFIEVI
jgi:phage gp46-like protein